MKRLNFVTKIIGGIMLAVVACILISTIGVKEVRGTVLIFWLLLTAGIVLACEKFMAMSEIENFLDAPRGDTSMKQLNRLFFIIPIIFVLIALVILVIATFGASRLTFWLIFLFNASGILLLYSNSFIKTLKKVFDEDNQYEHAKRLVKNFYDDVQTDFTKCEDEEETMTEKI